MDLESRRRWIDYSRAKDEMMVHTDTPDAPWFVVEADDKKAARLNCMAHVLARVPYEPEFEPEILELPPLEPDHGYVRPDPSVQHYVPDHSGHAARRQEKRQARRSPLTLSRSRRPREGRRARSR